MKQFLLPCALLIFGSAFAQTPLLEEDFESYNVGDFIGASSPIWSTWSGTTGGTEDAQITDEQANSGTQSLKIFSSSAMGGPMDVYLPIGLETAYDVSFNIYIPFGNSAYFNIQEQLSPGNAWAFDFVFGSDGQVALSIDQADVAFGSFLLDSWVSVQMLMDPINHRAEIYINGEYLANIPFDDIIGGVNFYGFGDGGTAGLYYIDDIVVVEITEVIDSVEETPELELAFGPNPANNFIQVHSNITNGLIRIMALNGKVVKELNAVNMTSSQRIDLNLDNGIYLVELTSNGNRTMRKLVVSH